MEDVKAEEADGVGVYVYCMQDGQATDSVFFPVPCLRLSGTLFQETLVQDRGDGGALSEADNESPNLPSGFHSFLVSARDWMVHTSRLPRGVASAKGTARTIGAPLPALPFKDLVADFDYHTVNLNLQDLLVLAWVADRLKITGLSTLLAAKVAHLSRELDAEHVEMVIPRRFALA